MFSSEKIEWETPQHLFDKLNNEFNFTLDVCADETNYKCNKYYTVETDGLDQEWNGVIWMNPPYGKGIDKWMKKAYISSRNGAVCVCLVPVRSDTKWWHNYVMNATEVRLINKRVKFGGASSNAPFPSAVVIFRPPHKTYPILSVQEF
jgi:phage N-6-adenine-methyltransferase